MEDDTEALWPLLREAAARMQAEARHADDAEPDWLPRWRALQAATDGAVAVLAAACDRGAD